MCVASLLSLVLHCYGAICIYKTLQECSYNKMKAKCEDVCGLKYILEVKWIERGSLVVLDRKIFNHVLSLHPFHVIMLPFEKM